MDLLKHKTLWLSGAAITAVIAMNLISCSPAKWHETQDTPKAVFTGDPVAERQTAPVPARVIQPGDQGFVSADRLCLRRLSNRPCDNKDPVAEKNDKVVVVDPAPQGEDKVIQCRVERPHAPPVVVYVPPQYINQQPMRPSVDELAADRYFVVQNIATEKLRVYERCTTGPGCAHHLIYETDMVVGQNSRARRTMLGSYRLTSWFKFYEDNRSEYPSWHQQGYPRLPAPGADILAWASESLLPQGRGSVRGAFGWYTAYIGPNADEQWMHGTWGWGSDQGAFIQALKQRPYDHDPRLASHGCSRIENQGIAMLREILVPGTKVIKIYARESYRHPESANVTPAGGSWSWILTADGAGQENGSRAGRAGVIQRRVPRSQVLEHGRFHFKAYPTAVPLTQGANVHRNGNSYGIQHQAFAGVFLVDEGRVAGYRHPHGLRVGGHADGHLPRVILAGVADEDDAGAGPVEPQPPVQSQDPGQEEAPPVIVEQAPPPVQPAAPGSDEEVAPPPQADDGGEIVDVGAPPPIAALGGRPDSRALSCAQAQNLVSQQGAVIMTTGENTFDRFVADRAKCEGGELETQGYAPTLDNPQCPVGSLCTSSKQGRGGK